MSNNIEEVDLLDEDKPISGQKYVCLSFVSPENILKQKEHFMFEEFLKYYDFMKSMSKFEQFLAFISYKYDIKQEELSTEFKNFVENETEEIKKSNISDEYKTFIENEEEQLTTRFQEKHGVQTNVRGLKVRGVFDTLKEAEIRSKLLRRVDPHHDVYVGQVGVWMPWEPSAYKTGKVEYLEKELNTLMKEKYENEKEARNIFEERIKNTRKKAFEENKKKAKKYKTKLTQRLNKKGELVGVQDTNTIETTLGEKENVNVEDIRKELFEGDNIRTKEGDRKREEEKNKK